ncbi:HAMP domain-containing sensor histidine kinase [Lacticaseibacillus pabuli]|uniref:histidine kinase n=1 Tax=Lacticaseibacillus pabuli TaxID=3025672 RepID=A0ABY7WNX8_9LACO|nr:HAMP domain-containing sensor histidine kinase [Lacticaseibacillus sp. KACC 23028]WDF81869.1 HAMP domain-containing sensor histidine kinase [Lacticaseibacillus sp. KACC 23028]
MKLIYQQMLSFLALIIVALTVVSLLFIQTTASSAWDNNFRQLAGFTNSIEQHAVLNDGTVNAPFLDNSQQILASQQISFGIYNAKNQMGYPQQKQQGIDKKSWRKLKTGEDVSYRGWVEVPSRNGKAELKQASIYYRPVFYSGKLVYVIGAFAPVKTIQASLAKTQRNVFIGFVISAIAALILSYFLAQVQVRKINRLRNATHEVAQGNYDVDLKSSGNDEIGELTTDFGEMTDALKAGREEIKRQEDRRRQFMADAAHEMRTPLTTINGLLEGLAYDAIPEDMRAKSIELMRNETGRLIRLVNENLDYEKIRSNQIILHRTTFNGSEDLHNIVSQLTQKSTDAGDVIKLDTPDDLSVYADHDRFVQVIFNIVQNAIQFTQNGTITITARRGYHQSEFSVSDTGIGMTADQVKNIWERYYKADPSRKNTKYGESGLGMAIVHQLMQVHGGKIDVESKQDVGTTFRLSFPDEDAAPSKQDVAKRQAKSESDHASDKA